MNLHFFSSDLIGDSLMQTPAFYSLKAANPDSKIIMHCPPGSITAEIFSCVDIIDEVVLDNNEKGYKQLSCVEAFNWSSARHINMIHGYSQQLGLPIINPAIRYNPPDINLPKELQGKQFAICARHSTSCTSNSGENVPANKCFSNKIWLEIGEFLDSYGIIPVAIGSKKDLEDDKFKEWPWLKIYDMSITEIGGLLKHAAISISTDTGIRFMAANLTNFLVISPAVFTWLVSVQPQLPNQRGIEINVDINNIDVNLIKTLCSLII